MTIRPETRSQWEGEVWDTPLEAAHPFAGATLALIPAAPRSYPSPLTAILPNRQVVEGAAARAAKSLNADGGDGPNDLHRARSQSEPTLSVQSAPQILPSHGPAPSPGDGSRFYLSLWRSIGSKCDRENRDVGERPINQMVDARRSAALAKSL